MLCGGCDTLVLRTQYQVGGPITATGVRAMVSASDQEAVKEIVKSVATEMRFEDRTDTSLVPGTLARYAEPVRENPMSLVAWVHKEMIVIDLFHNSPVLGETQAYQEAKSLLLSELRRKFGNRVVIAAQKDQISGLPARTN